MQVQQVGNTELHTVISLFPVDSALTPVTTWLFSFRAVQPGTLPDAILGPLPLHHKKNQAQKILTAILSRCHEICKCRISGFMYRDSMFTQHIGSTVRRRRKCFLFMWAGSSSPRLALEGSLEGRGGLGVKGSPPDLSQSTADATHNKRQPGWAGSVFFSLVCYSSSVILSETFCIPTHFGSVVNIATKVTRLHKLLLACLPAAPVPNLGWGKSQRFSSWQKVLFLATWGLLSVIPRNQATGFLQGCFC